MDEFSRPATFQDLKLLLRSLHEHAETIDFDGIPVKAITLEGLLLTKKTMRDKDAADRIIIERALEVFKLHTRDGDEGQGEE